MKKHVLHISGTHCSSCKILIEDILGDQSDLENPVVSLKLHTLDVESEIDNEVELANKLTQLLQRHGYRVSTQKYIVPTAGSSRTMYSAILIGVAVLVLFFWLQKSGILNIGIGGDVTPTTSFLIGLVASVSSCLAVVGGLVLSLSAKVSQDKVRDTKTFILFHGGRVVGFALLGGVLGLVGGALGINFTITSILGVVVSLVMILLGLNLVGVTRKKVTFGVGLFKWFRHIEHQTWAPLLVGVGTFFLPCGFTQSMQIASLSSGSFLSGMFIMFGFALGTLPVLVLLSFGSASLAHSRYAPLFFKSAGVVVIGLGLFSLLAGMAGIGIINPLFIL